MQNWFETGACDGFNILPPFYLGGLEDFVNMVTPELQRRGAYPTEYIPGTLREKLFGKGPYLPPDHPAGRYRDLGALKAAEAAARSAAE